MKYSSGLVLLLVGGLASCGGGGGSAKNPETANTTQQTAISQGMVTGFGSVIVNGIHHDVKDAVIEMDGESQLESDLAVGQMVSIKGALDPDGIHGKAVSVKGNSHLIAPIDSIDLVAGSIVAFGQKILLTPDTFYDDGLTPETLKVGDLIRVASYTNAAGEHVATRIDIKRGAIPSNFQLVGKVANLDTTAQTFTINGKTVDYAKATIADLPNKTLANDMIVRVHGRVIDGILVAVGNVLLSPLDIKHNRDADKAMHVHARGVVKNLVPGVSFDVDETTVLLTADTRFDKSVASDLAEGLIAKVHGTLNADKELVASKVKLIFKVKVDDEGLVQSVDLTNNSFNLHGVTFNVTPDTSFNDRGKNRVRLFSLKDLVVGDVIHVRGYQQLGTSSPAIVATRVERHNPGKKGERGFHSHVNGKIDSVVGNVITVNSHKITLPDTLKIKGYATTQEFLNAALGLEVKVKGMIENDVFIAHSIELED